MAATVEEHAAAKINLTLRVLGRRADGYHEIESLVVFANCGDRLALRPGDGLALSVTGPFATQITGANLVETAARALSEVEPSLRLGSIALEKNIPVAAGLGGGSADAAALLRAARRANPSKAHAVDWHKVARSLGADVLVCLEGTPALMYGIGERLVPLSGLPAMAIVLANPRLHLAAGDVYRSLHAGPASGATTAPILPRLQSLHDLVSYATAHGNDLEPAAIALCPQIAEVRAALSAAPGALLARMSGSGPTCFALFRTLADADAAAAVVQRSEPDWWVVATDIA